MTIVPNDPDGLGNIFWHEFMYSIQSGSIKDMPLYLGREQDANLYDFMQSFDRVALRVYKEIFTKRLLKVMRLNDLESVSGDDMLNLLGMFGLPFYEGYTLDTLKARALAWANNPEGGTERAIKRALYYYIGSGAFVQPYDIDNGDSILIESAFDNSSGWIVWGTDGIPANEGTWGDSSINSGSAIWGDEEALTGEDFIVKVILPFSGSSSDRTTYQYWNLDENRIILQRIIAQVKPIGFINTLKVLVGY